MGKPQWLEWLRSVVNPIRATCNSTVPVDSHPRLCRLIVYADELAALGAFPIWRTLRAEPIPPVLKALGMR
eukprot:scaffold302545_cov29-Prasinocladus_malaysianus.AAC.1